MPTELHNARSGPRPPRTREGLAQPALALSALALLCAGTRASPPICDGAPYPGPKYSSGASPSEMSLLDVDSDGDNDLAVSWAEDGFSFLVNAGCGTLTESTRHAPGVRSTASAFADLNGDGHQDAVLISGSLGQASEISVVLSTTGGAYAAPAVLGTGLVTTDVALGDIDGDGDLDAVISAYGTSEDAGGLLVYANGGDGTFDPPITVELDRFTGSVILDDLDGDGDLDAIATTDGAFVPVGARLLRNTGDGTLVPHAEFFSFRSPESLQTVDINGDGENEIVAIIGDDVAVIENLGSLTFGDEIRYPASDNATHLAAGDIDNDGDADIAVTDGLGDRLFLLLNQGDGTLALQSTPYKTGDSPRALTIGDLDGDGNDDVVYTLSTLRPRSSYGLFFARGDGSLIAAERFTAAPGPRRPALADIDNDGDLDAVVTSGQDESVFLLTNSGGGSFEQPELFPASAGDDPTLADLNGDGRPDVLFSSPPDQVCVVLNSGNGAFAAGILYPVVDFPGGITVSDLNGDGAPDVTVVSPRGMSILTNNGDGTFAPEVRYANSASLHGSAGAVDLNADALTDLVVTYRNSSDTYARVWLNDGNGSFHPDVIYLFGRGAFSLSVGDLDNDGAPDLIMPLPSADRVSVLFNDGDGTFATRVQFDAGNNPNGVALGDLNDDGSLDIVVSNTASDDISVLLNPGDGMFVGQTRYDTGAIPSPAILADLEGDGDLDIVVDNRSSNVNFDSDVSVLLNQGDGTFTTQTRHESGDTPSATAIGDLDGDGDLDLVQSLIGEGTIGVLLFHGSGGCPCNAADLAPPYATLDLADLVGFITAFTASSEAADLDGNGIYDLADVTAYLEAFTAGCPGN